MHLVYSPRSSSHTFHTGKFDQPAIKYNVQNCLIAGIHVGPRCIRMSIVGESGAISASGHVRHTGNSSLTPFTQVNRMSRSRRVLATGGKQRIFGLDMVCIETILFHLDSFEG